MQASAGARKYAGEVFLEHLIKAAIESYPHIPVCMHQDHGQSPAVCQGAINLGFSSVMMDGSLMSDGKTISTFDYNVNVTKEVVNMAHKVGVSVEGELGCLGSLETMKGDKEDGHGTDAEMTRDQLLTDPDPRRLQIHSQADRRHPFDSACERNSCPHPEYTPCDARLFFRSSGILGRNS